MGLYRTVLKKINKFKDNINQDLLANKDVAYVPDEKHIAEKVSQAKRVNDPSPYVYIQNIWTQADYQEVLKKLPTNDHAFNYWWDVPVDAEKGRNGDYRKRFDLPLSQAATRLDKEYGLFWLGINKALETKEFGKSLLRKFDDIIQQRYGMSVDDARFEDIMGTDVFLMRHEPGYFLGPHTDRSDRIATLIFYLPETDKNPELGTSLFNPKQKGFVDSEETRKHYLFDKFDTVYTAPYVPNSAFFFPQTNYGFHGVLPIDASKNIATRYGMQVQFYDKRTRKI